MSSKNPLLSPAQTEDLFAALADSASPVRIAVLRALVRLPLDPESTGLLRPMLAHILEPEIAWTTFVPSSSVRDSILDIVQCTEEEERSLARETMAEAEEQVRKSGQDSFRITSRFAQLALNDYDPNSENLLADAEDIARQAEELGKWYSPDVAGLYNVYRVWLRRAANFWFQWLEERRHEYDPATQMPSWFPMQEGPLAVSRQIEWAVSRGDTAETLAALHPALTSSVARDRFAAAQLIEWSERTKSEPSYWRFGGGSGPGDAIQAAVRNMLGQGLNSGSPEQSSHRIEAEPSPAPAPGGSHGSIFGPMKHSVPAGSPLSSAASPAPGPPAPAPSSGAENSLPERRISFWIAERESSRDVPLELGVTYHGNFRVGLPVAATLFGGADIIPDADIPPSGLKTRWQVVPSNLRFAATDPAVTIAASGEAEFGLLVPKFGDSLTVTVALTRCPPRPRLRRRRWRGD